MGAQRRARVVRRRGHMLGNHAEQRLQVGRVRQRAVLRAVQRGAPGPGRRVHDRELDLLLGRVQVEEELVAGIDHLGDAGVRPVHLVDYQDHRQPGLERLAQHEPGLRQRALAGVHQQQHAVDHGQAALDLAAEVGVPRRVDDVDGQSAVVDRGVLGQDRDALLPLQVAGVEHPLGDLGVRPERPRLPEHRVDQRGLAVVDVRDDRDVAKVVAGGDRGDGGELSGAGRHARRLRSYVGKRHSDGPFILLPASFITNTPRAARPGRPARQRASRSATSARKPVTPPPGEPATANANASEPATASAGQPPRPAPTPRPRPVPVSRRGQHPQAEDGGYI